MTQPTVTEATAEYLTLIADSQEPWMSRLLDRTTVELEVYGRKIPGTVSSVFPADDKWVIGFRRLDVPVPSIEDLARDWQ